MPDDVCVKPLDDDEVTEPDPLRQKAPDRFGLFYDGKDTGVTAITRRGGLDAGVELMQANPTWMKVEVRDLEAKQTVGGDWRNPKEGRLIRSKESG